VQTDHGSEFTYIFFLQVHKPFPFEVLLREKGVRHKLIPIGKPEQNGKVECSHRIDEEGGVQLEELPEFPTGGPRRWPAT
jgi:transposase InsO family protein